MYIVNKGKQEFGNYRNNSYFDRTAYVFGKTLEVKQDSMKVAYTLSFHEPFVEQKDLKQYYTDFTDRDNIFYNGFYLDNDGYVIDGIPRLGTPSSVNEINWFSLILFILLLSSLLWYIAKRYSKSKPFIIKPYNEIYHDQIGGWMIFLLLLIATSIFTKFTFLFFRESFFNLNTWRAIDHIDGGAPTFYKMLLISEMTAHLLILVGFVYSFILMIKKRDIFAQTFFLVTLFMAIFYLVHAIGYHYMSKQYKTVAKVFGFYFIDIQVFNLFLVDFRYI